MKIIEKLLEIRGYVKKENLRSFTENYCEKKVNDLDNLKKLQELTEDLNEIPEGKPHASQWLE